MINDIDHLVDSSIFESVKIYFSDSVRYSVSRSIENSVSDSVREDVENDN